MFCVGRDTSPEGAMTSWSGSPQTSIRWTFASRLQKSEAKGMWNGTPCALHTVYADVTLCFTVRKIPYMDKKWTDMNLSSVYFSHFPHPPTPTPTPFLSNCLGDQLLLWNHCNSVQRSFLWPYWQRMFAIGAVKCKERGCPSRFFFFSPSFSGHHAL